MKNKILVISLAVALVAILSFSTLAWFTSADQVENTFTVGSVKIRQDEQQHDEDTGVLEPFEQDQTLLPVVDPQNPAADENYVEKIVTVTSTGNNPAYVRTHIAVPTALADILTLDISDSTNWVKETATNTCVVKGVEYTVYSYTYNKPLAKDETSDVLLEGVYLNANVDVKNNDQGVAQFCTWNDSTKAYDFYEFDITGKVSVLVATQGVQSQGFADAASALNTAFPQIPDFAG